MADPIRELIFQNIESVLAAVTDIEAAIRPEQNVNQVDERPSYIITDLGDLSQVDGIRLESDRRLSFSVKVLETEADPIERVQEVQRFQAEAVKALMADETRGGNAISTMLQSATVNYAEPIEPIGTALLIGEVVYRVDKLDPFVKQDI